MTGLRILLACLIVSAAPAQEVRFNRDIRPILSDKCYACHGPDEAQRSTPLRFDSEQGAAVDLLSGGKAIVAGNPDASKLLERVRSEDPVRRMPPAYQGRAKLSEREIALLERWIEQGAQWEGHWAFQRIERPDVPADGEGWARNPIDRFVARRLAREDLAPNPEADRASWARRAALDLTGLPATPDEVDAFLADHAPNAYESFVDRLLASPRYGERMAFRWLEAARYADTNGYQNDEERDMWRWRDWVIEAFNKNLPFDDFTIWQIAGDLLPHATLEQRIATGFNRNHRGNGELGIVPAEYHVEYVVDRVEATSTVWMGLTLGCARCHDHKYDPLTQKEFYQFYAYFNQVPDRGRYFKFGNTPPLVPAPTSEQQAKLEALDARIAALKKHKLEPEKSDPVPAKWLFDERLTARAALDDDAVPAQGVSGLAATLDGERYIDLGDEADFDFFDPFTLTAWIKPESATGGIISRMKANATVRGNKGYGLFLIDGKLQFRIESTDIDDRVRVETVDELPLGEWRHVAMTYDGSRLAKGVQIYVDGVPQPLHVIIDHSNNNTNSAEPLRVGHGPGPDDRFVGLIDEARVYDRALGAEAIEVVAVRENPVEISELDPKTQSAAQRRKLSWARLSNGSSSAARAWRELRSLELERETLIASVPTVMVMADGAGRETHILERGVYDAPGESVEPGLPAVLPDLPKGAPNDRLGLAQWLVSRDNPLTARVTVNRFWQMLFGGGIVETVENFGSQGAWPTHPELLDWLAADFMESGWDVKGLFKQIVLSATYRQGSQTTPDKLERDPANKLYSRGPRVRLPAETIRDQALAVAGLLSEKTGGPSVKPYQPAGLWTELSNWKAYQHDAGDDLYRRSLYTFWKRTIAPPSMLTFDAAPRETCIVSETRTNTPLQALDLMNDVTYVEAARKLGERMLTEAGPTTDERLEYGFRLATARAPQPAEEQVLLRSYQRYKDRYQTRPDDAEKLLQQGDSPRNQALEPAEYAAYMAVASVILNLDETITKE